MATAEMTGEAVVGEVAGETVAVETNEVPTDANSDVLAGVVDMVVDAVTEIVQLATEEEAKAKAELDLFIARQERKMELQQAISAQYENFIRAEEQYESIHEEAKECKKGVEFQQDRLNRLTRDLHEVVTGAWFPAKVDPQKELPFGESDGEGNSEINSSETANAFQAPVDSNAWKTTSIDVIGLPVRLEEKLREEGFNTVGDIEDGRSTGRLKDVKGIGEAKFTLIENGVIEWLAAFHRGPVMSVAVVAGTSPADESDELDTDDDTDSEDDDGPDQLDDAAYQAGWSAAKAESEPSMNPHKTGTLEYQSWSAGFSQFDE